MLVALADQAYNLWSVKSRDLFGSADFGPGSWHLARLSIVNLDKILFNFSSCLVIWWGFKGQYFDSSHRDIVHLLFADLLRGDSPVCIELVFYTSNTLVVVSFILPC